MGTVFIEKLVNGQWIKGRINNVYYVPKLQTNLFSVGTCCTLRGFDLVFSGKMVYVLKGDVLEAQGVIQDNKVYRMFFRVLVQREFNALSVDAQNWNERLGHVNQRTLVSMAKEMTVQDLKLSGTTDIECEASHLGKSHRLAFKNSGCDRPATEVGELFHSDVCGPMEVESLGGSKYYLLFKDDASSYRSVYFIKHKSDVYECFKEFERAVHNKFGRSMKTLRTDCGKGYCNKSMKAYLAEKGIKHETTALYTPEQNGRAERDNRSIMESACSMLLAKSLPSFLWAEAVGAAVYLLNR